VPIAWAAVPTAALVSFRLGQPDGVSVVAESWRRAITELGFTVTTVAGAGDADHLVHGLAFDSTEPPAVDELAVAVDGADVVVAENILSIPLNLDASRAVAAVLRGRPTIVHHHDPPWQNAGREHVTELPIDDPAWRHVVINRRTQREMAQRGIEATVIYNAFDVDGPRGDRAATRAQLGVDDDEPLLLHPVRAIPRKNIPGALALAEAVGGTYWLPGTAEDGYGPTLEALLATTTARVLRTPVPRGGRRMADAYAACDAVLFPSHWEGFGNPPIEAALHRRPAAVGTYPVSAELLELGFRWLPGDDGAPLAAVLADPSSAAADLEHNWTIAGLHFAHDVMRDRLDALLTEMGWGS
jgi:glycosyltransferase involved in cell wall biosynthesis